jgi:tetratricopeptide (TPR) repeat protein
MLHLWVVLQFAGASGLFAGIPTDPRLDRLQAWMTAVEGHVPGSIDGPAAVLRGWNRTALADIHDDMFALSTLIAEPGARIQLYEPPTPTQSRRPKPGYTPNQMAGLRLVANGIRRRHAITDLLKRGALLHTDVALRAPAAGGAITSPLDSALQRTTLYLDDGRQQGLDQSVGHLEMAQRLLDLVRPNPEHDDQPYPERDAMVRQWYRATTAILIERGNLDLSHFNRALRLFPEDPEILFMVGALREMLAAPRIQDGLRTAQLPSGLSYAVDSDRDELRRAEALFRRSLTADPTVVETHLRLGRVLGLLGRPADAAKELKIAASGAREPLLRYYSELFLGRELDALGERGQARASYERAAALYPLAQSPHIGLSELAMRAGESTVARAAIQRVWQLREPDDPLWVYHYIAGRHGKGWLTAINAMFAVAGALSQ